MRSTEPDATAPHDSASEGARTRPIAEAAKQILEVLGILALGSSDHEIRPATERKAGANPPVPVIAIVGAGGKSTTTFSVATALANQGRRVVVSTTTKMGHDQTGGLNPTSPNVVAAAQALEQPGVCLVVEHPDPSSPKVVGPPTVWFDELASSGLVDAIVLEANDFFVNQAVLTGETFPAEKRPGLAEHKAKLSELRKHAEKRAELTWLSRMLGLEPWPYRCRATGDRRPHCRARSCGGTGCSSETPC